MNKKGYTILLLFILLIAVAGGVYWKFGSPGAVGSRNVGAMRAALQDFPFLMAEAQNYELLWAREEGMYYLHKTSPELVGADVIVKVIYIPSKSVVDELINQDVDKYRDFAYAAYLYYFSKDDRAVYYIDEINRYTRMGELLDGISGKIRPINRLYSPNGSPERKFRNNVVRQVVG